MIVLFNIYDWLRTRTEDKIESEKYFSQLYDGLKPKFACRSYSIMMLLRRAVFIYIALFFTDMDAVFTVLTIFILHCAYLITMIILRSYEEVKDNIVDIMNEVMYLICIGLLFYYNKASH